MVRVVGLRGPSVWRVVPDGAVWWRLFCLLCSFWLCWGVLSLMWMLGWSWGSERVVVSSVGGALGLGPSFGGLSLGIFCLRMALRFVRRLGEGRLLVGRFSAACRAFGLTVGIGGWVRRPRPAPGRFRGVGRRPPVRGFPEFPVGVDGGGLECVGGFTCLGGGVDWSASLGGEVIDRIARATGAFGRLRRRLWGGGGDWPGSRGA